MKERIPNNGETTIKVTLYFRANSIAKKKGAIIPKRGWAMGLINVEANESHGIRAGKGERFNTMAEIPARLEKLLADNKIELNLCRRASNVFREV